MASSNPSRTSLYPEVIQSNPDAPSHFPPSSTSTSSLYPTVDITEMAENLFPDHADRDILIQQGSDPESQSSPTFESSEEVLIKIPGAIVHLIDKQQSVELACGDLTIVGLRQGDNVVAVLARVGDEIQWPLARDEAAVKLDESHYFFTLHVPPEVKSDDAGSDKDNVNLGSSDNLLNYGLTIASKGQEGLLRKFDGILGKYSAFSEQEVSGEIDGLVVAKGISPDEMKVEAKEELLKGSSAAYWTTLAPNVEDYSTSIARMIAAGSGQLIKGILWCGDITVDRLKWGHGFMKRRMGPGSNSEISPEAMRRMKRVKKLTKMSEKVATGILSGVVKVSGFFTSSIVNSKPGKKFFSLLPGEIVLASLDGFNKVCDAVEVAGRNVMSTSSVVTTGLISQKYGEEAGKVTTEGLDAAGHAIGTAWAVFKIRKALNPKGAFKPTTIAKAAASASLKSKIGK